MPTVETQFANLASKIERVLPDLNPDTNLSDPIFELIPIVTEDTHLVDYTIRDNSKGLQGGTALEGKPAYVSRLTDSLFRVVPGVFRDVADIAETEITELRDMASREQFQKIEARITDIANLLAERENSRIKKNIWTTMVSGTQNITDALGNVVSNFKYARNYSTAGVAWSSTASAKPLYDMRALFAGINGRTSSAFGPKAKAFANSVTINHMLNNSNAVDLGGKFAGGGNTAFNSLDDANRFYAGDGLPQFVRYDEGYYDDDGTWQKFLADGYVVFVGARPGNSQIGKYVMTRNAVNPNAAPGQYFKMYGPDELAVKIPPKYEIHRGHNGCPVFHYPSAIRIMYVL